MNGAASRFGGDVLSHLKAKAAARPSVAQAQRLPLDLIDEDPNQPRKVFDDAQLKKMAASMRRRGVLQPVGVAAVDGGRYLLRVGARRVRAARMAGLTEVPAVLMPHAELEDQVIENQHRAPNTDSELAMAVARMTDDKMTNAEIASALNLDDPQSLKHYRALLQLHETAPPLAEWIDRAPVRALYELNAAWQRAVGTQRCIIMNRLAETDELTVTSARRIVAALAVGDDAPDGTAALSREAPGEIASPLPASKPERKAKAVPDIDAERLAIVRAWIENPDRPRPPLNV